MATQDLQQQTAFQSIAVGVFPGHDAVVEVIRRLHAIGFQNDRISVLTKDEAEMQRTMAETGAHDGREVDRPAALAEDLEPSGTDEVAGMAIGGGVGLVLGLSAIALPGFGAFLLAAGPIAIALHGLTFAAGGVGLGALFGAIVDERATEEHREHYEKALATGQWIVAVHGDDDLDAAVNTLRSGGASRVDAF